MKDRTRRYETGKMLMDVAKYFATVTGIGSLANESIHWAIAGTGFLMALLTWVIGFFAIPEEKDV